MKKMRGLLALGLILLSTSVAFQNCSPSGSFSTIPLSNGEALDLGITRTASTNTSVLTLATPSLSATQGQSLTFTTRFNASPMAANYTVFVHFVNSAGGESSLSGDYSPTVPTTKWKGLVTYNRTVSIPSDMPTGTYTVRMGLYANVAPYNRVRLTPGTGVTVDGELRYTVGTLKVLAPITAPAPAPAPAPSPTPTTTTTTTTMPPTTTTMAPTTTTLPPTTTTTIPPASSNGPAGQDPNAWSLVFSDEFNGTSLNTAVWNDHLWYETSNPTKNYSVENGSLLIWPQRDASGNFFNRTIDTDGKYETTYGYFEAEAKLPVGRGTWPAFWLYAHPGNDRPEIDMMEAYSGGGVSSGWSDANLHPTNFGITLHKANADYSYHDVPFAHTSNEYMTTPDLSAAFHKYAAKWDATGVTFYFDGKQVGPKYSDTASYYNRPMYILLDLWFGSASGTPDSTTPTGKANAYIVNYVRVWKAK